MKKKYAQLAYQNQLLQEEWDEERMNIIGQNGNDGIHYDQIDSGSSST